MSAIQQKRDRIRKLREAEEAKQQQQLESKYDGPDQLTQEELLQLSRASSIASAAAAPRQIASSGSGSGAGKKIVRPAAAAATPTPSLAINEQVVIDKAATVQVDVGSASDFTAIATAMSGDASSGAVRGRASRLKTPVKPKKASSKRDSSRTRAAPKTDREAAIEQMGRITALLDETSATWLGQFKARLESAIAANDAASIEATIVEDAAHFEQDPGVHRLLQADEQLRDEMTARLERVAKIRAKQLKLA